MPVNRIGSGLNPKVWHNPGTEEFRNAKSKLARATSELGQAIISTVDTITREVILPRVESEAGINSRGNTEAGGVPEGTEAEGPQEPEQTY